MLSKHVKNIRVLMYCYSPCANVPSTKFRDCGKSFNFPDYRKAMTCSTCARSPARCQEPLRRQFFGKPRVGWHAQLGALDMEMDCSAMEATWSLLDDPDLSRPAGYEKAVKAQTVLNLCHQGNLSDAVEALGVLVQTGCRISKSVFYVVLKKCVGKKDLALGRRVHALSVIHGYESDTFLCNHILRMYASHGRLQDAMDVFTMVAKPDTFMWSSIIYVHVKRGEDKQAILLYHRMRRSSVKPDGHVFVAALQACAMGPHLETGQQVHADVLVGGFGHDLFVCNSLVDMYAKCGSLEAAHSVFDGLSEKNVVTWNALIAGYSQHGMGQEAIRLYNVMQDDGIIAPDSVTFLCLLQACASVGSLALEVGQQLHVQIREGGHEADVFVANSLVNMYAKCGSLVAARTVFDKLRQKDVVTWNAMIAGYSQHGMGKDALCLYREMQDEGIMAPDAVTFVCLLQACAGMGKPALEKGKQIHAHISEQGHQADVAVAGSLVNMYAKCGSLEDAQRVFDRLGKKSVVTWTALIAGYSQQGMGQEALHLYTTMQEGAVAVPNCVTFVCLLQACASIGTLALEKGKQLHAEIRERRLHADVTVANSLVNMYAKCGSLEAACGVFDRTLQKDVVTWNAMIAGYSQQGMGQDALYLYREMQDEGTVADPVTFASLLQACGSVGTPALETGKQLHVQIRERGYQDDALVANSLVNMYAKCGSLEDAHRLFDGLVQKDVVTWNAMIAGYSQQGMGQAALHLYSAMQEEGMAVPNSVTYVCLLQACARIGTPALGKGIELYEEIRGQVHETDAFVANSLVNMYAKCGSLEDAQRVFDGLGQKDVATWNAMIAGYSQQSMGQEAFRLYSAMQEDSMAVPDSVTFVCLLQACASMGTPALEKGKQLHLQIRDQGHESDVFVANSLVDMYAKCGSLKDAQSMFDGLGQKNVVTWTAMIAGYTQQGKGQEALLLYNAMHEEGIAAPNSVTFVCLLRACADDAALHLGRQLHSQIEEQGLQSDVSVAASLINMYGKSGSMIDAQQVFDALAEKDVATWNALIAGYTCQGDSEVVFGLMERMKEDGIHPVGITFLSILTVCSHAGLVDKGREYFEAMSRDYSVTPTVEHYTCLVDLLGRAGRLDEALALVRTMSVLPNAAIWHTLLGACRTWTNVGVGCHAFTEAMKLDSRDAAAYLLMSNIYTSARMWEQAQEIHARRVRVGAWKQPGQSWWTDLDGLMHIFVVGDRKHPMSQARLDMVFSKVKKCVDLSSAETAVDCVTGTARI